MITVDQALNMNRGEIRRLSSEYMNPGLVTMLTVLDFDKRFTRAEAQYMWDHEGNRYLDCLGAYGALNLGHNPPQVLETLEKVRSRPNLLQASLNPLAAALAHNLASVAPGRLKHCFFCNSGAEAVEGALKLARAATGKTAIVYCHGSFHGKTLGALSVTGRKKYQAPFEPLVPGCEAVPYGDADVLQEALKRTGAGAFIVEPIQGEGGVVVPPDGYLAKAREITSRAGALLIVDEVQTGLGRTGTLFACEHESIEPDILCLAKSLGGGIMPVGATLATPEVWRRAYGGLNRSLLHTSTFGGNTWAMAAGLAALQAIIENNLPRTAAERGEFLMTQLRALASRHRIIKEVRGRGLLVGIEFAQEPASVLERVAARPLEQFKEEYTASLVAGLMLNRHRIITAYTLNNPNVIRLEPPLVVSREDLEHVASAIGDILEKHPSFASLALATGRSTLSGLAHRE
ncbi:MAG: aspartate aminotransferase family protein [Firmicutes bacterium]|nr:aspartate aminotransferase family protein [Bacillota bacterium]